MSANVSAPSLQAPRVSIISSSEIVSPPSGDGHAHWQAAIHLLPLSADQSGGVFPVCPTSEDLDAEQRFKSQVRFPFVVYTTDTATSYDKMTSDELMDRARQKLAVTEPWYIEQELWEDTQGLGNPSFVASESVVVSEGKDPVAAFSDLDSAVANDQHDGRGTIHMTTEMFDLLIPHDMFRREGNVWFSPLDNIVVPGRGYTGNGPNASYPGANPNAATDTAHWMFGHPGVVQIMRSEVIYYPEQELVHKSMDRPVNDVWVSAQRVVAFVISNGTDVVTDAADPITGFYTVSADMTAVPGAGPLVVSSPLVVDETGYVDAVAYIGHTLLNDSGAAATVIIYEGSDNTGAILDIITLVDGESTRAWYDPGIKVAGGIYVDVTVGTINVNSSLRYLPA